MLNNIEPFKILKLPIYNVHNNVYIVLCRYTSIYNSSNLDSTSAAYCYAYMYNLILTSKYYLSQRQMVHIYDIYDIVFVCDVFISILYAIRHTYTDATMYII